MLGISLHFSSCNYDYNCKDLKSIIAPEEGRGLVTQVAMEDVTSSSLLGSSTTKYMSTHL
jgi:hypothetical protein